MHLVNVYERDPTLASLRITIEPASVAVIEEQAASPAEPPKRRMPRWPALSTTTWVVISIIITLILIGPVTRPWINAGNEHVKGNRGRMVTVLRLELLLVIGNIFIYTQTMHYFQYNKQKGLHHADKAKKKVVASALLFIMVGSHLIYVMYYAPKSVQFFLFEISSFLSGFWTNLLGFTCGFFLVNTVVWLMQKWQYSYRVLSWLTRTRFMHSIVFDRRTQIKAAMWIVTVMSVLMWFSADKIFVKNEFIKVRGLSTPEGRPLRLAMLSDIHAGASVYEKQIERLVDEVLQMPVDAIVIVGDMTDGERADIEDRLKPLWILPTRVPVYFVTGNHDYYYGDVRDWLQLYESKGIHVLHNNNTMVEGVCLAGVDDIASKRMGVPTHELNVSAAISGCPPGASKVLLCHNPSSLREMTQEQLNTIDVILSGHTHAGQFYVVAPVLYLIMPYLYGQYNIGTHGHLFVTAGTFYQGPAMKMIGLSEIWMIVLVNE